MASVQFHGIDRVLEAYENRNAAGWSIWVHKQFMFRGIGEDTLRTCLETLGAGSSNAVYTLKVYDGVTEEKNIKSKTEDDGSFNFKLNAEDQIITNGQYQRLGGISKLEERLGKIEEMLAADPADPEESDQEKLPTIGSLVNTFLANPSKALEVVAVVKSLFTGQQPPPGFLPPAQPAAAVGSADAPPGEISIEKLYLIIEELNNLDPKLCEHLEKLAKIGRENPGQFQMLLGMLEKF